MRKAVVLNHYRLLSSVYEVYVYHFRSSAADVIHPTNPFHLIVCFELFRISFKQFTTTLRSKSSSAM